MLRQKLELLDAHLDRLSLSKRLQIEAEHLKRIKVLKTVRIYVTPSEDTIKINTRIIDSARPGDATGLWDIVKRVVVSADTSVPVLAEAVDADGHVAAVEHATAGAVGPADRAEDVFEWTRECGGEAFVVPRKREWRSAQLLVKLANSRQVYKLHSSIARLFNKYADTKPNIIKDFYRYINDRKLNDYSTSDVLCDAELEAALGMKTFNFNEIAAIVDRLVEPCGYCVVNIGLDACSAWDINVECDDLGQMPVLYPKIVQQMEKKIETNRQAAQKTADRIALLEEFAADPMFFINRRIVLESETLGMRTGFYDDMGVQNAVFELIKRHEK
ncbi:SWI/SNF-related matrix-associated actin-dependent regulator of chromatin subfamily D [Pancytospora philotis]|nr:SWI/SNF-related matrix-associated actin-dependent regulator of chromatin subfamily D [Pancytospora philotis]